MLRQTLKAFCILLLLAALVSSALALPSQKGYSLKLIFHPGLTYLYRLDMSMTAWVPGSKTNEKIAVYNASEDMVMAQKVLRILPNHNAVLSIHTNEGRGLNNGQVFKANTTAKPAILTFAPNGDMISFEHLPRADANAPLLGNVLHSGAFSFYGVFLPRHKVSIGQAWVRKVHINGITGKKSAIVKSKLIGWEKVGLYHTLHIHAVLTAPIKVQLPASSKNKNQQDEMHGTMNTVYDTDLAMPQGIIIRTSSLSSVIVYIRSKHSITPLHLTMQMGNTLVNN